MSFRRTLSRCFILLGFFAALPASAADMPPSRVGRVSAVEGTVAVRPTGGEWADSAVNYPIASGMSVRTPAQGRAVLRIGAETIALAASSELDLARLDSGATQIVLRRGRIGVGLSQPDPARAVEIDVARGGVWVLTPGDYDITAGDERAPARIAVFDGRAHLVGGGSDTKTDTTITTGSASVLIPGTPALAGGRPGTGNAVAATLDGAAVDDFVVWWRPAGGDETDREAPLHLSTEITGIEALDGNGRWETVVGYGAAWFPTAAPDGWAPYRYGHWQWVAPWGWSWIDDMSWGFAPSHYGRWASIPEVDRLDPSGPGTVRWGWVPGAQIADPVYAPALVAFLGTAGVGLSYPDAVGPAVAWFPLAPGDIYWPSYTDDIEAIRRINQGAVADPSMIGPGINGAPPAEIVKADYPNRRFAAVVPRSVFLAGRPVVQALLELPGQRLANAPLLPGSPQIAPVAPRSAAVASASGAATRLAASTSRRLVRTMRTLGGLLRPPARTTAARTTGARTTAARPALLARSTPVRATTPALSGRLSAWSAPQARSRLRLAANHRAMMR